MKKSWILLVLLTLSALVFTSCATNAETMPSPSPSASPMVTLAPTATTSMMPTTSPGMGAGITTLEDAVRISSTIKKEVEKLSELSGADVVASGNMAIVGIQYATQYQGGLTDRLKQMVDSRVQTVDKALTVVHVTDDKTQVQAIQKLAQQMEKAEITFAELQTRMLEISSQIAGPGAGTGTDITSPQATTGA